MKYKRALAAVGVVLICAVASPVFADDSNTPNTPNTQRALTWEEGQAILKKNADLEKKVDAVVKVNEAVMQKNAQLEKEVDHLKEQQAKTNPPAAPVTPPTMTNDQNQALVQKNATLEKKVDELTKAQDQDAADNDARFKTLEQKMAQDHSGLENLVIAGDAAFIFGTMSKTPSSFAAGISPLILWQPTPNFLVESAFSLGVASDSNNNSSTSIDLGLANASFILNDYCIVGGGLFASPIGNFHSHFDPPWIYKFVDSPLIWGNRPIGPTGQVGVYASGAIPVGPTKVTYNVFAANAPNLITNTDVGNPGTINFDDFTALNYNKAVGGRFAFLPVPECEIGYSIESAEVNPAGFRNVPAAIQAIDVNWRPVVNCLGGQFDIQGEYLSNHIGKTTYDPHGTLGFGPLTFSSNNNGGYAQVTFRPTKADNRIIRNIEFGARWDYLNIPSIVPGGGNERRWTAIVEYWFESNVVLQAQYEWDFPSGQPEVDAFTVQLGVGL